MMDLFLRQIERSRTRSTRSWHARSSFISGWSRENVSRDPRGYIAFELTALCALGHDAGIPIEVRSDYSS